MPTIPELPPLRWLSAADVEAAMPAIPERLALAERTLVALATPDGAELPPKLAIHPRPAASFVHAMPAIYRGATLAEDRIGMKWVAGFATNTALGLPGISATVILNDPATGFPTAILDGGPITAQRTAAVSGVAIARFGPAIGERPPRAALIGAGVQGHSHLPVFGHVLPGVELQLFDRDRSRAEVLARAAAGTPGIGGVTVHDTAREAVEVSDVVLTAASFGPAAERQSMTNAWLAEGATIVPIDYATYCAAEVARDASLFLVDHRDQYLYNRDGGNFDGYPEPHAMLGEAILAGTPRPAGRVVVSHLGVGLADVVFADAIVARAMRLGLGIELPR
ncbi:MAG: ornithine cyclodeaminase family protein [Chloroflexota bacterium]|nr:MAG: ornithine cyclodeaminase family protein [Chloroflexota bacterium]